jgi:hypothetical protein
VAQPLTDGLRGSAFIADGDSKHLIVTLFSVGGTYPRLELVSGRCQYYASAGLVYTAVPAEPPNEFGYSEIAWIDLGQIRFWGALALSIPAGKGFYVFVPKAHGSVKTDEAESRSVHMVAERLAREVPQPDFRLHWERPDATEVAALHAALTTAEPVLLRGISCYLKGLILWNHYLFLEEMGMNMYIAQEAALSILRRRLSTSDSQLASYSQVFDFIASNLPHGESLAQFWRDTHDDRNDLLHPDGPYAILPMSADDLYELPEPLLALYRYLLLGRFEWHS